MKKRVVDTSGLEKEHEFILPHHGAYLSRNLFMQNNASFWIYALHPNNYLLLNKPAKEDSPFNVLYNTALNRTFKYSLPHGLIINPSKEIYDLQLYIFKHYCDDEEMRQQMPMWVRNNIFTYSESFYASEYIRAKRDTIWRELIS